MTTKTRKKPTGLKFNANVHRYWLDGKPVPGVTTILGVLNKPAIPRWAAKSVAEYVANNRAGIEELYNLGPDPMTAALSKVPWQKMDDAATRGTTLHDHAEAILRGEDVHLDDDDPLLPVVEHAVQFMDDWHIEPILIEVPVASREHWYAGTLDLIAKYRNPHTGETGTAIFDWKSGKAIYPEACMQLNAYAHAEFYGLAGEENPLPEVDAAFGLHIRPDGTDVHALKFGPEIFQEFVTIRRTHDIQKRMTGNWKVPGSGYVGIAEANKEN